MQPEAAPSLRPSNGPGPPTDPIRSRPSALYRPVMNRTLKALFRVWALGFQSRLIFDQRAAHGGVPELE